MPRICMKRGDIPAGFLQVLDLKPNTSQRNLVYQPVGQTKYVRPPDNGQVATTGAGPVTIGAAVSGLSAWIISNTPESPITQSVGDITVVTGTEAPGDTITIGGIPLVAVAGARTSGSNDFSLASGTAPGIAGDIIAAINDPANFFGSTVTSASGGGGVVDLTAVPLGTAGDAITLATTNGVAFAVSGGTLSGGVDGAAISDADANTMAQDILDNVLLFDDNTGPAVDADLAAINAEIAATVGTASITAAQLPDVLDILAGRIYTLPTGFQVENAGGNFDPVPLPGQDWGFVDGTLRNVFDTGSLRVSMTNGRLEKFMRHDFNYGDATGTNLEALVVYDDDGTIFVP